jgi:hypothetical protein
MNDAVIAIDMVIAKDAAKQTHGSMFKKLVAAMKAVRADSFGFDISDQFLAAVVGVAEFYGKHTPEYDHIMYELEQLKKFGLMIANAKAGLNVSLSDLVNDDNKNYPPIGLTVMWRDILKGINPKEPPTPAQVEFIGKLKAFLAENRATLRAEGDAICITGEGFEVTMEPSEYVKELYG